VKVYQVVDENNIPQYGLKGKHALHTLGNKLYHRSSHVFIEIFGGKFILQKKAECTENGGLWSSSVSGHGETGESERETAVRETEEELGLGVYGHELYKALTIDPRYHYETNREFVTLFTYLLDPSKEHITLNRNELDGVAIVPLSDLKKDIKNNSDRYSPVFVILFDLFLSLKGSIVYD